MKKVLTATLLSVLSAGAIAAEQCENPSGYWRTVTTEVCDTRTVYVDVEKTKCEYEYDEGNPRDGETEIITIIKPGHVQCDASINVWVADENRDGGRENEDVLKRVGLSAQTHYMEQQQTTEQFNCRLEEEQVWVERCDDPRDGGR